MPLNPTNLELHGLNEPLDEELHLHAGPISCIFEPARGYLRRFRIAGQEVLQLVYLHVRAEDWGTVMPEVKMVEKTIAKDHFHLVWEAHSVAHNVDVVWRGEATGSPDGTITYRCAGHAVHKTVTNRTGVCILIPAAFAGQAARLRHPDGTETVINLPVHVSPVEPVANVKALSYHGVTLELDGDVYNAEDQRNWTDNSYKVYPICGTRSLYTLQEGAKFMNAVTLRVEPQAPLTMPAAETQPLPELGVRVFGRETSLEAKAFADFLHLELPQDSAQAEAALARANAAGLPLALEYHGGHRSEIVRAAAKSAHRVVGLDLHGAALGAQAREALSDQTVTGAGFFADLNFRGKIDGRPYGVFFGAMPQIHTFDETSILDNARTLAESARSARLLAEGAPVHASLSLAPAHDPRLNSHFGAVWLLICLARLAGAGVESVVVSALQEVKDGPITTLLAKFKELRSAGARLDPNRTNVWGDVVRLGTDKGDLIANRTRTHQPLPSLGEAHTLTAQGWTERASHSEFEPYELLFVQPPNSR